jgi:hypothetical protein
LQVISVDPVFVEKNIIQDDDGFSPKSSLYLVEDDNWRSQLRPKVRTGVYTRPVGADIRKGPDLKR